MISLRLSSMIALQFFILLRHSLPLFQYAVFFFFGSLHSFFCPGHFCLPWDVLIFESARVVGIKQR